MILEDQFAVYLALDALPVHELRMLADIHHDGLLGGVIVAQEFGLSTGRDADVERQFRGRQLRRDEMDKGGELLGVSCCR